jgi:fucokinase
MTADLLGSMAAGLGGLRSGPARNPAFGAGLRLLEAGRLAEGLAAWSRVRDEGGWLDTAARLVRAARHYEGGVQLLIRQTVMSAQAQVRVNLDLSADQTDRQRPPLGVPVIVRCPARLDLSGGWTDTPPICYELGGQVVDLAITLDGVKPIGCRAVRIPELRVEIVLPGEGGGGGGDDEDDEAEKEVLLHISNLTDMADHCNPVARGALVKCCLLAAGLIRLGEEDKTTVTLASQLEQRLGSGLRLELWSDLPQAVLEKTRVFI